MDWPILAAAAFFIAATVAHLLSILTAALRLSGTTGSDRTAPFHADVSIIRPVCGLENFIEHTLRSTFHLEHDRYEIVFCVASASDPVVPLVRRLIAEHPHVPSRLLVGYNEISSNPKLNNMVKGWDAARSNWIVMADSNVLMPRDYIARLFDAWRADTALVCSPPVGCAPDSVWAQLECAILNTYQARWQCAADAAGLGFAQGKTMLWRRDFLNANGGIKGLAAEVAEDAAATKLVRRAGLRVSLVCRPFEQPLGTRSAAEVWYRQIRWARLRRSTFPSLFALEIFAGPLVPFLACAFLASAEGWPPIESVIALAVVWYGAEALLAYVAGWHLTAISPAIWILRDLMMPVIWFAGWAGNSFEWRGNSMRAVESKQTV